MARGSAPEDVMARLDAAMAEGAKRVKTPTLEQLARKPRAGKPRPSRAKTHEESFADLDPFLDEARSGMGDEALCRAAGVSDTAVKSWRRARGIQRLKGWQRRREEAAYAVDTFGDGYDPGLHAVASEVNGTWEFPEFVLRLPVKYTQLCRLVHALVATSGIPPQTIAAAFGLRERDIVNALNIQLAHLVKISVPCKSCGAPMDPAYGKTCSIPCKEKHDK